MNSLVCLPCFVECMHFRYADTGKFDPYVCLLGMLMLINYALKKQLIFHGAQEKISMLVSFDSLTTLCKCEATHRLIPQCVNSFFTFPSRLHGVCNENPLAPLIRGLGLKLYRTSGDNSVLYDHDLERYVICQFYFTFSAIHSRLCIKQTSFFILFPFK